MVERVLSMDEVAGSMPATSTLFALSFSHDRIGLLLCSFLLFDLLPPISLCFFLIWHPEGYLDLINHLRLELLKICVHTSTRSYILLVFYLNLNIK